MTGPTALAFNSWSQPISCAELNFPLRFLDSRRAEVDSRFAQVDSRFAQVDARFAERRIPIRNDTRTLIATHSVFLLTAAGVALGVARLLV